MTGPPAMSDKLRLGRCNASCIACFLTPGRIPLPLPAWRRGWNETMSWSELERLVDEAETDEVIRRVLRHCRSSAELLLAARRLGFRITRVDLQRAWQLQQQAG
jgi:hypothetical protein